MASECRKNEVSANASDPCDMSFIYESFVLIGDAPDFLRKFGVRLGLYRLFSSRPLVKTTLRNAEGHTTLLLEIEPDSFSIIANRCAIPLAVCS
jgi:hypothetical protein